MAPRPLVPLALAASLAVACAPDAPDPGPDGGLDCDDCDGDGFFWDVDCDDRDPEVHPGATEVCDHVDNDCDGYVNEGVGQLWYRDADDDGYGDPHDKASSCWEPLGYVPTGTDCDDGDPDVNPGAEELCDGVDNDCDDRVDEDCE